MWFKLVTEFDRLFTNVVGRTESICRRATEMGRQWYRGQPICHEAAVEAIRRLIGADDFANLASSGTIDPRAIRFSHNNIKATMKNGECIHDLTTKLKNGLDPSTIEPIRIAVKDGKVFTLDNRRLKAFRDAGIPIPYKKLDSIPKREMFKFSTTNDGIDIFVRPGG